MYAELETGDQRLHEAYGLLECKNTKRAIVEVNKSIKKNPKSPSANALKALILLRTAKLSEAYQLMNSVMQGTPSDRDTLQFLSIFFRELDKEETLESYLKSALEKFPKNRDLLTCLFFIYVRMCNFNAQQAIARKLCQIDGADRGYKFWLALSTILQGEKDANLANRMFLPLAERILEKALGDNHFSSHDDLFVYLSVLTRLKKFSEVVNLLNDKEIMGKINNRDYDHDYSSLMLKMNSDLGNWPEMFRISTELLEIDCDNWLAWQTLLQHCFEDEDRRDIVLKSIEKHLNKSPKSRGPQLAMIDFSANLIKREIKHPKAEEAFCIHLIKDYFKNVGHKPVGPLDLAYVLPLVIKSDSARFSLVESVLEEARASQNSSTLSADEKVHSEVCAYRIARTNGVQINLADLISAYQSHAKEPLPPEKDITKEMMASDGLLQLAISELLDPVVGPAVSNDLGRLLLSAYWLSEIGLKNSPANHFMRMKLSAIMSPCGGLACVGRLLQELKSLNLKEILSISICHVAITPGPFLTIFGNRVPFNSSLPDQQYVNLANFYESTVKRIRCIQRETENCLVRSYQCNAFGRIHENTQFLQSLGRTDVLVLAQTELIYNRVLIKCDCFDDVLERMGHCGSEVASVKEALANVCDNRDFSVVPEFFHKIPNMDNRRRSFDHLRAWMNLRLDLVSLIGTCSKLVMKAVPCIDEVGSGYIGEQSCKDLSDIVKTIDAQSDSLVAHLKTNYDVISEFESTKFKYADLLLAPDMVCATPPPLPLTTMTSFYFHGPFHQTLMNGVELLKYLIGLLIDKSNSPLSTTEKCLSSPLLQFVGESSGIPGLPSPPQDASPLPDILNPSAALIGLAVALEAVSLAIILTTAAVAMLRPRRMVYQPLNIKSKKNKKKQQQEQPNNVGAQNLDFSVTKRLDQAAVSITTVLIPQIQHVAEKLQGLSQLWAEWSSDKAAKALTATAIQAVESAITETIEADESFPWCPTSSEDAHPPIFCEIANDLTCGFTELAEAFSRKSLALKNALFEVECFANLKITTDSEK